MMVIMAEYASVCENLTGAFFFIPTGNMAIAYFRGLSATERSGPGGDHRSGDRVGGVCALERVDLRARRSRGRARKLEGVNARKLKFAIPLFSMDST